MGVEQSNEQILVRITQLKEKVKTIVKEIQDLKRKFETSEIPAEAFKENKAILEDQLRDILQQIAQVKETAHIQPKIEPKARPKVPLEVRPEIKTEIKPEIQPEVKSDLQSEIKPEIHPEIPVEVPKKDTMEVIDKEIKIAEEAKELMYFFQTEFEESVTKAKIYLSITLDDHFVIEINYENYPQQPELTVPSNLLKLFDNNEKKFHEKLLSYSSWNPEAPKKMIEIITEIESVLINLYGADINSITRKSEELLNQNKETLKKLIQRFKQEVKNKNYTMARESCSKIIDKAYELRDRNTAKTYSDKYFKLLKKK